MNRRIPLFPLKLVVFPQSKYPLHIFEERYKKLINLCINNQSGFGIAATVGDEISSVGVYVKITQILKMYESGEMDIIVQGANRFVTQHVLDHPDGYLIAEVESYSDELSTINYILFDELKDRMQNLFEQIDFELDKKFWYNLEKAELKSFKIAEKSALSLEQQQELLTYQTENKRLKYLINHFDTLQEQLEENSIMKEIIMGDGYIN